MISIALFSVSGMTPSWAVFCGKTVNVAALTSQNYDGDVVADLLDAVGISAGSRFQQSWRGSCDSPNVRVSWAEACRDCHRWATRAAASRQGRDRLSGISSRGDNRPCGTGVSRAWKPRGRWTDLVIPWPFSRAIVLGGPPIYVPEGLTPQQLGPYRDQVQAAMDLIQARVDRYTAGEAVDLQAPWSWIRFCHPSQRPRDELSAPDHRSGSLLQRRAEAQSIRLSPVSGRQPTMPTGIRQRRKQGRDVGVAPQLCGGLLSGAR